MSRLHRHILDPVSGLSDLYGAGVPDVALSATVGSTYRRSDGVAGDTLYQRTTTGWEKMAAGSLAISGSLINGRIPVATGASSLGSSQMTQYAGPDQIRSAVAFHPETDGVALGDSAGLRRWAISATTISASGALTIGGDTNLYRASANVLATDDALRIAATLYLGTGTPIGTKIHANDGAGRNFIVTTDATQVGTSGIAIGSFNDTASAYAPLAVVSSFTQFNSNVGIGVTPSYKLHVLGSGAFTGLRVQNNDISGAFNRASIETSSDVITLALTAWGTGSVRTGTAWLQTIANYPVVIGVNDGEVARFTSTQFIPLGNVVVSGNNAQSIYTWITSDTNWRIGMNDLNATVGFSRALATQHVQYVTFASGVGQGFAVGDAVSGLSAFEVVGSGNGYNAYFRGNVGIGVTPAGGYQFDVLGYIRLRSGYYLSIGDNGYIRGDVAGSLVFQGGSNSTIFRNSVNSADLVTILNNGTTTINGAIQQGAEGITVTVPALSPGWYRVATWAGTGTGRGAARVILSTVGGSLSPTTYEIDAFWTWGGSGDVSIRRYGSIGYITGARLVEGVADRWLEVQVANTGIETSFWLYFQQLHGYYLSITPAAAGALVLSTGGTVRSTATSPTGVPSFAYAGSAVLGGTLTVNGGDNAIWNRHDGNASNWYGRITSANATGDRTTFIGSYGTYAVVAAHNYAMNAWADLYINTVDGAGGGAVRMPANVFINGNQAIHAGNYNTYAAAQAFQGWVVSPGIAADSFYGVAATPNSVRSGFTYGNNAPLVGTIVYFPSNGYDLQLNSSYSGGSALAFRSRNGDIATWNSWRTVVHTDGGQTIAGITTFSATESVNLYGIRGRFALGSDGAGIHLFSNVIVGEPGGWGNNITQAPSRGLGTWGALKVAYGNNATSIFQGAVTVTNGNSSHTLYGPNTTWGGRLYVGATPQINSANTASVIATDGNLHLDSGTNNLMYLQFYSSGQPIYAYGALYMQNGGIAMQGQAISGASTVGATHIGVNPSGASNNGYGISLYGGPAVSPTYGIMFQGTLSYGTHGAVTGDWATYFTMDGTANRGWVFRNTSTGNVASINNAGTAVFNGTVTASNWILGSDLRQKEHVTEIRSAMDEVRATPGLHYWHSVHRRWELGFGAQHLEQGTMLSLAVHHNADGYLGVYYDRTIPVLWQAVREQDTEVTKLKRQVAELQDAVRALGGTVVS